jgi:hypothetical protein
MGKKGCELSKNLRQEMVLNLIERFGRGDGLTTRQVHSMLSNANIGTSFRTTLRDLEELSSHFPVSEYGANNERRWFWTKPIGEARQFTEERNRKLEKLFQFFAERNSNIGFC